MAISGDYPTPVTVNGYACRNCTDVDLAKKHIDPAHPKDGPFGVNADPERDPLHRAHGPAFRLDGRLKALLHPERAESRPPAAAATASPPGGALDLRA